jgi:hypothetical protein
MFTLLSTDDKTQLERFTERDKQLKNLIAKKTNSLRLNDRRLNLYLSVLKLSDLKKRRLKSLQLIKSIRYLKTLVILNDQNIE